MSSNQLAHGPRATGTHLAVGDLRQRLPERLASASLDHCTADLGLTRMWALLHDARIVHMYAPYTLVRGALENACASVWMLQPPDRTERILRRLRFAVNDINHGEEARDLTGQAGPRTKAQRLAQVRQIARQSGADEALAVKPVGYKEIVRTAGDSDPVFILA